MMRQSRPGPGGAAPLLLGLFVMLVFLLAYGDIVLAAAGAESLRSAVSAFALPQSVAMILLGMAMLAVAGLLRKRQRGRKTGSESASRPSREPARPIDPS